MFDGRFAPLSHCATVLGGGRVQVRGKDRLTHAVALAQQTNLCLAPDGRWFDARNVEIAHGSRIDGTNTVQSGRRPMQCFQDLAPLSTNVSNWDGVRRE